jgi:HAMP domain-containing protein
MGILAKYSLWLLGILLLAASCITGAALWYQRDGLTREAILRGESIARNLATSAADAVLAHDDLQLISLSDSATHDNQGVVYGALLDPAGKVIGHHDQKALGKPLDLVPGLAVLGMAGKSTAVKRGLAGDVAVWDVSVPIVLRDSDKVLGSAHVGLALAVVEKAVRQSMLVLSSISLAIMALGVSLTFASLKVLVRPLRELSSASEAVGKGHLDVSVPVRSSDEVGRLANNFNTMIHGLKEAELARSQQSRIESELAVAHSIQEKLLLAKPPQVPGLEVAFRCIPAKELGGDFYDCIEVKGGKWGFLIADVSGKGVPAALHMANLRNLFRIFAPESESPLATLKKVNAMAYPDLQAESFVTMIYAVIDPQTLQVRLINAGHDPAYWMRQGAIEAFDATAPPVGLAEASDFDPVADEISFTMAKGDLLFTFTDGVTEAMNAQEVQFSLKNLKDVILQGGGAGETLARMQNAIRQHAGGADQSDDITMLAVKAG